MSLLNGVFTINPALNNSELIDVAKELFLQLDNIQEVSLDVSKGVATSATFALLASVKKSAPHIKIPLLEDSVVDSDGIGAMLLDVRG